MDRTTVAWALAAAFLLALAHCSAQAAAACPNDPFRSGPSAELPDCRAYELVSPPDTDGRRVSALNAALPLNRFPTAMGTDAGNSFLFFTAGAPLAGLSGNNGTFDQYEAVRSAQGWSTARHLSPTGAQAVFPNAGGVSPDHRYSFYNVGPVNEGDGGDLADGGEANYLGNPDGTFELIGIGSLGEERLAEGRLITADGAHIIFTTGGPRCAGSCPSQQLEPAAPETGTPTVYDRPADGPTRVVSLLPGEVTPAAGEAAEYQGASGDGSVIAFTVAGTLYVRVGNAETKEVAGAEPTFGGVSADGSSVTYVLGGNVFVFDVGSGSRTQVNTSEDAELVNVSADGSHVYFVSPSQLDGGLGLAGEPNLYVWSRSRPTPVFVATADPADIGGLPGLTNWTSHVVSPAGGAETGPGAGSSRSTPDGNVLVFESRARLTAYETTGRRAIYRYDSRDGSLLCVSCSPLAEAPSFDARLEAVGAGLVNTHAIVNNLSADGSRVFFETNEPLLERDVDGTNDIYEWQLTAAGVPSLALISSGRTPKYFNQFGTSLETNILYAVSASGNDVFFGSWDKLVPAAGNGGVLALYDARVGGGFAEPVLSSCVPEACRGAGGEPAPFQAPLSSTFAGKGNVGRAACKRPKRAGKKGKRRGGCRRAHHGKRGKHRTGGRRATGKGSAG